ncbi:MAG: RtcB family protein [Planctomycetaceae bacterium]|nr:RtcB family protein [Planctomycetaceae bacterium]
MDKRFRYREKWVHDLPVGDTLVRVWDAAGAVNGDMICSAFRHLAAAGFVWPYVALMPDYHPGEGSMIGSVVPTRNFLLPTVIGGDLGCGMTAVRLPIDADRLLSVLPDVEKRLRETIPVGTAHNSIVTERVRDNPIWESRIHAPILANRLRRKMLRQFASLGGGNHFLEFQRDQEGSAWAMLHSGSRYLGVTIRDYYVEQGQQQPAIDSRLYAKVPHLIVDTPLAGDYLADLQIVVDFARASRKEMMLRALEGIAGAMPGAIDVRPYELIEAALDIAHNFVAEEEHFGERVFVHRKGAIRLAEGEVGLIPGSMGTSSYVVEGRDNAFGFNSCSHGAGRAMSRGDAFRDISDKDFRNSMEGVSYQHDARIKDEAPAAYKDIRRVMRAQKDLVRIVHELQPLLSIKGR